MTPLQVHNQLFTTVDTYASEHGTSLVYVKRLTDDTANACFLNKQYLVITLSFDGVSWNETAQEVLG
jgi:hypothetical protein